MTSEKMRTAHRVASELLRDRLRDVAPEMLEDIEKLTAADVIVTQGKYDHIEDVFSQSGTPFTLIDPAAIDRATLRPDQIIFVNCPGEFSAVGLRKLATFVAEGGYLFTTDWALKHVLEPAFPGYVEYNQQATRDEVVRVEVLDMQDPFLSSILGPEDDPQWWLEGSSYPIRVLDKAKVKVLVISREIEERYGEPAVFITFDHGEGRIYHMISHFYLQRTETRTKRQSASSNNYLIEKGMSPELAEKYRELGADEVAVGEVESAYVSQGVIHRMMIEKVRQRREREKQGEQDEA